MDLRERVVAAVDAGMTQPQAATRFGVSLRTVERYLPRRRATGSLVAPAQRPGPQPRVRQQLHAWLPDRLDAAADATRAEHVAAFVAPGGGGGSPAAMARGRGRGGVAGVDVAGDRRPAARAGAELTPGGRRRRAGRPLKSKA